LAGFTSGEGSFIVAITKYSGSKSGVRVQLRFQITQHSFPPPAGPRPATPH